MEPENPYDLTDTCKCFAYSPGECACGGYVESAWARIWREGYDAGVRAALNG